MNVDGEKKTCESCKYYLGGGICEYSWEPDCADDSYELWEGRDEP